MLPQAMRSSKRPVRTPVSASLILLVRASMRAKACWATPSAFGLRRPEYGYLACAGRGYIDVVESHAVLSDDAQVGRGFHALGVDAVDAYESRISF